MSSGTSTPQPRTASPEVPQSSPLTVGTRFVKQYYNVLSTTPEQIGRFYQASKSFLSAGEGSGPAEPELFQTEKTAAQLRDRFYQQKKNAPIMIRFEFEHGAIDAQWSVQGGVLLVVTGHVVYYLNDNDDDEQRRAFVHTFFLGSVLTGTKRSYYVHNDVLRFLNDSVDAATMTEPMPEEQDTAVATSTTATSTELGVTATAIEEEREILHKQVIATDVEEVTAPPLLVETAQKEEVIEAAPGHGVEESKEVMLEEHSTNSSNVESPVEPPAVKQPTGSWASMVARSGSSATSTPTGTPAGTPVRPTKTKPKTSPTAATTTTTTTAPEPRRSGKRDPDCTLVLKNIADGTTEADILALVEPFSGEHYKILGTTVSVHKAIAFVDYDQPAPVLSVVERHQKEALRLKDRVLEIYQKTADHQQRSRRGQGRNSSFRAAGGSNGSSAGRGDRRQYHRRSSRGERAGRGGGRSIGGGGGGRS